MGAIKEANENNKVIAQKNASLQSYVQSMERGGHIAKALPSVITPERFTRVVLTALSSNKDLQRCTPESFLGAMMTAAQLGVEPNTALGQAYLIPYGNQCQFQLGYKGLIDLAYRSGEVSTIQARTVYENDEFDFEYGLDMKLIHRPAKENRGEPIYYYAVVKLTNGGYNFEVMSFEDMVEHRRKYSKARKSPWDDNFDEMAKKTVLKKALKYAPLKSEFVRATSLDEGVRNLNIDKANKEAEIDMTLVEDEVYDVEPIESEVISND